MYKTLRNLFINILRTFSKYKKKKEKYFNMSLYYKKLINKL